MSDIYVKFLSITNTDLENMILSKYIHVIVLLYQPLPNSSFKTIQSIIALTH